MPHIYGLPGSGRAIGAAGEESSVLATNLSPAERGSQGQLGEIQLNRLLVRSRCWGSVRLEAHS
jgi:hypothetical protein